MKIVFSNVYMSRFKNGMNEKKLKINLEMAKLSNFLVQSYGYKTCFYGDKKSLESFGDIKFNEHHELNDDRFNEMPSQIWSIGKLFSLLKINEPFIHMDYDIFLFKKFDQNFLNQEVLFYHNEFHLDALTKKYQNYFELRPSNTKSFINRSYNCALFGGKNFKLIQNICEEIINFILENKQSINEKLNSKESLNYASFMPALLVEQVWIFQLLKHYKQEFSSYLHQTKSLAVISKEAYIKNICHLQGSKSDKLVLKNIFFMNKYLGI